MKSVVLQNVVLFAVDISLQNATIFVNFPFLLPLLEFFTTPPPDLSKQRQRTTTASQTSLHAAPISILDTEGRDVPRHPSRGITASKPVSQVDAAVVSGQVIQMKIFVHGVVKEPDIVLLSDATRADSEALIVQVSTCTLISLRNCWHQLRTTSVERVLIHVQ